MHSILFYFIYGIRTLQNSWHLTLLTDVYLPMLRNEEALREFYFWFRFVLRLVIKCLQPFERNKPGQGWKVDDWFFKPCFPYGFTNWTAWSRAENSPLKFTSSCLLQFRPRTTEKWALHNNNNMHCGSKISPKVFRTCTAPETSLMAFRSS